ncbi:MAG: hypothetical protein ABEJ31_14070 [Haloarculaceae archaeon]
MRRRALLATAGSLLSAGCSALSGGGDQGVQRRRRRSLYGGVGVTEHIGPGGNDSMDVGVDGNFSTDLDLADQGIDLNDTDMDQNLQVELSGRDEQQVLTATADNESAKHIQTARDHLQTALTNYTRQAGRGAAVTDVTPTTSFSAAIVTNNTASANDALKQAADGATDRQKVVVLALRQVSLFLELGATADEQLHRSWKAFSFAVGRFYSENTAQFEPARLRMQRHHKRARKAQRALANNTDESCTAALEGLSEDEYNGKCDQLQSAVFDFGGFGPGMESLSGGLASLQDAVPAYENEEYALAARRSLAASAQFGVAMVSFDVDRDGTAVSRKARELYGVTRTLKQLCDDLQRSASAQTNDNRLLFREARRAARQHAQSNDIVRQMPTPGELAR